MFPLLDGSILQHGKFFRGTLVSDQEQFGNRLNSLGIDAKGAVHHASPAPGARVSRIIKLLQRLLTDLRTAPQEREKSSRPFEIAFIDFSDDLCSPDRGIFPLWNRSIGKTGIVADAASRTNLQIGPHGPVQLGSKEIEQFLPFFLFHRDSSCRSSFLPR